MRLYLLLFINIVLFLQTKAQNQQTIDSLKQVITGVKKQYPEPCAKDTIVINAYLSWGEQIYIQQPDSAIELWKKSEQVADKLLKAKPDTLTSNTANGLRANALNNIGYIYFIKDDILKALEYYNKSLDIKEQLNDKMGMATAYNNIGIIYKSQGDLKEGMESYNKSLKIQLELNDVDGLAASYNNIGLIHKEQGENDKALACYNKGLNYYKALNDKQGMANVYNNMATVYEIKNDVQKAYEYYIKCLNYFEELGSKRGIANATFKLGNYFFNINKFDESGKYAKRSYQLSKELGFPVSIQWSASLMKKLALKQGDYKNAYKYYHEEITMLDSVQNEKNYKQIQKQQARYAYEKQAAVDSIAHKKAIELKDMDIARIEQERRAQAAQRNMLILGLGLMLILAIIIYRSYRHKKKANTLLFQQKKEIEEQKQEILDSITYAKRIQTAILPPVRIVDQYLKDSFILYKPKDVVAGDFYWIEQTDKKVLYAAADCTGHGVPGAMVSVVCNNALNRTVREYACNEPAQILNKTRELVIQEFEKSDEEVKDGMDIALCSLEGNELKYAGANNPLWVIRNGKILETKANKQAIGKTDDPTPFIEYSFTLEKGDTIYIFSDGYVDQFGGEKGKKFKSKAFKALLLNIQDKSMKEQRTLLDKNFENWRGELEQVDDVCVIGVRV